MPPMQPTPPRGRISISARFLLYNILTTIALVSIAAQLQFVVFPSSFWSPFFVWSIVPALILGNLLAIYWKTWRLR